MKSTNDDSKKRALTISLGIVTILFIGSLFSLLYLWNDLNLTKNELKINKLQLLELQEKFNIVNRSYYHFYNLFSRLYNACHVYEGVFDYEISLLHEFSYFEPLETKTDSSSPVLIDTVGVLERYHILNVSLTPRSCKMYYVDVSSLVDYDIIGTSEMQESSPSDVIRSTDAVKWPPDFPLSKFRDLPFGGLLSTNAYRNYFDEYLYNKFTKIGEKTIIDTIEKGVKIHKELTPITLTGTVRLILLVDCNDVARNVTFYITTLYGYASSKFDVTVPIK